MPGRKAWGPLIVTFQNELQIKRGQHPATKGVVIFSLSCQGMFVRTCIEWAPGIKQHYSIPGGCLLDKGLTVL